MYISGNATDFMSRLHCLPVSGLDLVTFKLEGQSYTGALTGTKVAWNHLFAKNWAQVTLTGTNYYSSGAF